MSLGGDNTFIVTDYTYWHTAGNNLFVNINEKCVLHTFDIFMQISYIRAAERLAQTMHLAIFDLLMSRRNFEFNMYVFSYDVGLKYESYIDLFSFHSFKEYVRHME